MIEQHNFQYDCISNQSSILLMTALVESSGDRLSIDSPCFVLSFQMFAWSTDLRNIRCKILIRDQNRPSCQESMTSQSDLHTLGSVTKARQTRNVQTGFICPTAFAPLSALPRKVKLHRHVQHRFRIVACWIIGQQNLSCPRKWHEAGHSRE